MPTKDFQIKDGEVILLDLNFFWTKEQIKQAVSMWEYGNSIEDMYRAFRKDQKKREEIFLLLLHLARKGLITKRQGYLWGFKREEEK